MKDLSQLRVEIDTVDKQLMTLLAERMQLVKEVGVYKKAHGMPVVDMNRWQQVLASKVSMAKEAGLDQSLVEDIYTKIHAAAIAMEKEV